MRFRLLITCCLVTLIAIGLSFLVSISFRSDGARGIRWGGVSQGQIVWRTSSAGMSRNPGSFPVEERFGASVGPSSLGPSALFSHLTWNPGPNPEYAFPLGWLGVAAILLPGSMYLIRWLRISRRYRRGLCLACGYDLRHSGAVCPECATPRDVRAPLRWPVTLVPSGKSVRRVLACVGAVFSTLVIVLAIVLGWIGHMDRVAQERYRLAGLDITQFIVAASPRLSGEVVNRIHSTQLTWADLSPGNLVLLGEGEYTVSSRAPAQPSAYRNVWDVAIVGVSPKQTRLRLNLSVAVRLRLENLTIDCGNDPCFDLRNGGSASLKNCVIMNYNSGAGGSSAIDGDGTAFLIEDCAFDGNSGRQAGRSMGVAFDLRGENNHVYARNTKFIDAAEISRERLITFDTCAQQHTNARPISFFEDGARFRRYSPSLVSAVMKANLAEEFSQATDDAAFVQRVIEGAPAKDPLIQRLLDSRDLVDDSRYWCALYRDPRQEVRSIAAGRLSRLHHPPATSVPARMDRLPKLLERLQSPKPAESRQALLELLAASPEVIQAIRSRSGAVSGFSPDNLDELNRLLDLSVPLPVEVEYGETLREIER